MAIFGGVVVFEFQLWLATSWLDALAVILKVALCGGATFCAWEICLKYIRPTRLSYSTKKDTKQKEDVDVFFLPPKLLKKKVIRKGLMVPPEGEKGYQRVRVEDLSDGDIVSLELVTQDSGEHREFFAMEAWGQDGVFVSADYTSRTLSGHKVVKCLLRDWAENPPSWKRFCFQIHFNNGKAAFRSFLTETLLFMLGIKEKTMVAWRLEGNKKGQGVNVSKWECFELKEEKKTQPGMGPLYILWYSLAASYVNWESHSKRFNITNTKERAVRLALWTPVMPGGDTTSGAFSERAKSLMYKSLEGHNPSIPRSTSSSSMQSSRAGQF